MTNTTTTKVTTPVIGDRNAWRWGFTPQAEIWNGRLAMIGFSAAILVEVFSGQASYIFGASFKQFAITFCDSPASERGSGDLDLQHKTSSCLGGWGLKPFNLR